MTKIKNLLFFFYYKILNLSLNSAAREQGLIPIREALVKIIPDIRDQYTTVVFNNDYWINNLRTLHAFQIKIAKRAIAMLDNVETPTIVDIGDSSGVHMQYLLNIYGSDAIKAISVNIDPVAVDKVIGKGLKAIHARAELLHEHPDFNDKTNVFLSYEMLEHLFDPISFLHNMSTKSECDFYVITVPYVISSRVGMHQVRGRGDKQQSLNAETTHIFELSPDDWDLIFRFSGWRVVERYKYTQYPKRNPLTILRYLWRKVHFEGYYGVILERDESISKKYTSW